MTARQPIAIVKDFQSLNGDTPVSDMTYRGQISSFGFPTVMRTMHRTLKQVVNKVPANDMEGRPIREMLIAAVADFEKMEPELVASLCMTIGEQSAIDEIMQKRINAMTPADFIIDKDLATPDQQSVSSIRNALLKDDRERFAAMPATGGKAPTNEWAGLDLD